jgi:pumilio RNA-binding family
MQTCLKTGSANQQSRLVNKIVENVRVLIGDQFANYVVSEVIAFGEQSINMSIAKVVCADLGPYCCSKFSSSVVESLMKHSGNDVREMIFEVLLARENF